MTEMIAAEIAAYLEKISKEEAFLADGKNPRVPYLNAAASILRRVASGELAPVIHAYWKPVDTKTSFYFVCSNCGADQADSDNSENNFCDVCGARMDGKDDKGA